MSNDNHIDNIIENYKNMEEEIVKQLNYVSKHGTTVGSNREYIWKSLFERIVPKKFNIERSIFIMDSFRNISKEVDLAIYDEQYTPYIFRYGEIKFIPIEAVAAVIECKSTSVECENLSKWVTSISNLRTGNDSIVRINGCINYGIEVDRLGKNSKITQTSTTPIKILCHMGLKENITKDFDIVIKAEKENLKISYSNKFSSLLDWYVYLNHYSGYLCEGIEDKQNKIKEYENVERAKEDGEYKKLKTRTMKMYSIKNENTILSFIFQFNQLLMLINNPMFFPHIEYVNLFNFKNHGEPI